MQDFVYHNGELVVEMCGDVLITRERGRYVSAPVRAPEPAHNYNFEKQVNTWLDEIDHEDVLAFSEDPFACE